MKRYKATLINSVYEDPTGEYVKYSDVINEIGEKCDCCGVFGHDRRTLWMGCGYAMEVLGIPFKQKKDEGVTGFNRSSLYTLRVCKNCRELWLDSIKNWFDKKGDGGD